MKKTLCDPYKTEIYSSISKKSSPINDDFTKTRLADLPPLISQKILP